MPQQLESKVMKPILTTFVAGFFLAVVGLTIAHPDSAPLRTQTRIGHEVSKLGNENNHLFCRLSRNLCTDWRRLFNRANRNEHYGDYSCALEDYKRGLVLVGASDHPDAFDGKRKLLLGCARMSSQTGKKKEAIRNYSELIPLYPDFQKSDFILERLWLNLYLRNYNQCLADCDWLKKMDGHRVLIM